ncbi:hypothetical protein [Neorhizobium galegae]|uniref:hypothetical protein n=1 Tax=Neorhizobium galegae TaxID=399 RepID=UPI001F3861EC|nr:hypothetical protein [Neorhizobium galegae]UIK04105.1 hypothetical protein LZK81_15580 [Neorhizobium galegae]
MKIVGKRVSTGAKWLATEVARYLSTKGATNLIIIALILTSIAFLALRQLSRSELYASVDAVSELVRFRAVRPLIATIPLTDATLIASAEGCVGLAGDPSPRVTGLLQPSEGAIVSYRAGAGRIAIQIVGGRLVSENGARIAATFQSSGRADCDLVEPVTVRINNADELVRPLPIAGPADIGQEFGVPTMPTGTASSRIYDIMWEGRVRVFNRTYFSERLVPVADAEFPLPIGSRLSGGDNLDPKQPVDPAIAAWYGAAIPGEKGLQISATTISKTLQLYRPGTRRDEMETLGLSLLTSTFADSLALIIIGFVVVFGGVLGAVASWMGLWRNPEEKHE